MDTFVDIVNRWPSVNSLADDLLVKPGTVRKWRARDHIPSEHWAKLVSSARRRRISLGFKEMAEIRAQAIERESK